ncbi:hypothetical protein ACFWNR_16415, partial [Streptomyces virginiae]
KVVDELVVAGYVTCTRSSADRRRVHVDLTAPGRPDHRRSSVSPEWGSEARKGVGYCLSLRVSAPAWIALR